MDPADAEPFRHAMASQQAMIERHEQHIMEDRAVLSSVANTVQAIQAKLEQMFVAHGGATDQGPPSIPPPRSAAAASGSFYPSPRRDVPISTPQCYNGDTNTCRSFIRQCENVFEHQHDLFTSESARVAFVVNLLTGRALAWADALGESGSPEMDSYTRFSQALRRVFEHPNKSEDSASRLFDLRQGHQSVADYSVEFRIIATESGWNDRALRDAFLKGLSESLKNELATLEKPSSFEESVNLAIRMDNRLRERRRAQTEHRDNTFRQLEFPETAERRSRRFGSFRESEADSSWRAPRRRDSPPPLPPGEPMQLGKARLSEREYQRRLRAGLCLYCGQSDHPVARCPVKPKGGAH